MGILFRLFTKLLPWPIKACSSSKDKEELEYNYNSVSFMSFLLLVQKKEPKKITPATIPIAIGTAIAGRRD